ncbi:UDP-2,4-diacetamido-2,4,6-trideoxy-beta-L-altropyranose hydrolase [Neobacillus cucumis]|uniref:UDP-2,4-diacetamido-2,4, 6-trideoxy-beta-L-altropyranose hydrolase n=1 Tax=Neobacillus cucumis TaxID=1740721 RepID=UPI002E227388|nr:UDP-2,4-diacetamido-2,4,6-trideoxy-beta-L-altropyranose hydrolase [Neobacillus cucumis]MED4228938.1 UDP-2,4-diacetamido-2,4,6-trideoxy-beta-L-altropyranose hydrolase [Neobacillus cucumis]
MNVVFRVDASNEIGSGHVMRCLTLAEKLREHGVTVTFICREHVGHLCDLIEEKGFKVLKLPAPLRNTQIPLLTPHSHWLGAPLEEDAIQCKQLLKRCSVDLLIIDHYAIHYEWEHILRDIVRRIMVIDDLADRKHDCDLLCDPTVLDNPNKYNLLVPAHCNTFLGPNYVLLRPEFYEQGLHSRLRTGPVKRIFIFFGGVDPTNETGKALGAFLELGREEIQVDVVVGRSNTHKIKLKELCNQYPNLNFHVQINNMARIMHLADLSIGAGGSATWERCYLGLPTIVWSIAENQKEICKELGRKNVIKYLGDCDLVKQENVIKKLNEMIENEQERTNMSSAGFLLMKGNLDHHKQMIKNILNLGE